MSSATMATTGYAISGTSDEEWWEQLGERVDVGTVRARVCI
jgi:hypothetical protein